LEDFGENSGRDQMMIEIARDIKVGHVSVYISIS